MSREGEESVVRLSGLVDPVYSVTSRDEDDVVVVDLVGVGGPAADSLMGAVGDEGRQIAAYDGVVDLVTTATHDDDGDVPSTRVEIAMAGPGRSEVRSSDGGLEIRIIPGGEAEDVSDPMAGMDSSTDPESMASEDVSEPLPSADEDGSDDAWAMDEPLLEESLEEEIPASRPDLTAPAATRLTGIETRKTGQGVLVGIEADGAVGALEAFTLSDPDRLVVDLPGLEAGDAPARIDVGSGVVSSVRMGAHSGKVRIVLDGGEAADGFQGRRIMPGTTGLWIAVGSGEALTQAMDDALGASEDAFLASLSEGGSSQPAASDAPAAADGTDDPETLAATPVADESPAPMAGIDSDDAAPMAAMDSDDAAPMMESGGELATLDEAPSEPESMPAASAPMGDAGELVQVFGLHYERTDGMDRVVVLADDSIPYETIAVDATTVVLSIPGASISEEASDRIFPKAGGPISLIHAFQQPEVEVPEVRVVFTRAPNLAPVVSRRGSMLFIEFEDQGVAAAPPPAFARSEGGATGAKQGGSGSMPMGPQSTESAPMAGEPMAAAPGSQPTAAAPGAVVDRETMPGFESGMDLGGEMAAMDAAGPGWNEPTAGAPGAAPAPPAAVEVPAAIEVLEEGGLIDGKEYKGRRVSLDFKDVAIADVLRLIAEVSDLNIIAGDEVKGNVTIRLVDVPWDQALDVILMTKGLGFVRVGNVLRIAPSDVLKAEEEVRLQERRNKEKLEDLEVKLLPVNYAAVQDVEGLVKRLLSPRGTVNLDKRTNTLIIKDISSVIDEATALVAAIDTQTPQVMIEAKIVEANLDFSRELGSVWGVQTQQFTDPFDPDTPRQDLGSEDLTFIDTNQLAFANPITSIPTGLLTVGALILDQDFRVDAQIQAAESTGDGKVVSSPRIVTLDNKEAKIEQGVSIPFQTFEGGDAKLEFIDAVLSLIVTPHITADESIIMEIEVTRNAPDDTVSTPTGSPAIAKNVAETETLVKDGQTLVLGGIYTINKSKRQTRVPYLHRIPVIGNAFKSNEITDSRKELLVFVTPRVVRLPEMAER